jgi:hypothetical protein
VAQLDEDTVRRVAVGEHATFYLDGAAGQALPGAARS